MRCLRSNETKGNVGVCLVRLATEEIAAQGKDAHENEKGNIGT